MRSWHGRKVASHFLDVVSFGAVSVMRITSHMTNVVREEGPMNLIPTVGVTDCNPDSDDLLASEFHRKSGVMVTTRAREHFWAMAWIHEEGPV